MKYALIDNTHSSSGLVNIGDYVQSLAAAQYLPKVDFYVERDKLNRSDYEEAKLILNGWHTYRPENWPPNPNLDVKIISFHLNPRFSKAFFANPNTVSYLKKNGPVGCRDYNTMKLMEQQGIPAYYSFCLTTTLDLKYRTEEKTDDIYMVDVLYDYDYSLIYKHDPKRILYHLLNGKIFKRMNWVKRNKILRQHIAPDVLENAIKVKHHFKSNMDVETKFKITEELLKKYAAAKLVITSRIHCALPCLAMGTPVLFILDGLEDEKIHLSRFKGILTHINILSAQDKNEINKLFGERMNVVHPEEVNWNDPPKNPTSFKKYAEELKKSCQEFILQNSE
ncbi:polysaccharide pyruvyl transferase family protein [Allomuricauda sp. d1]|uniref:polysaccharide pyruvyl transferase family protein n=1 Tax=Allomuricauda sp. d1 TaxID=3136725 RepID=UPI0031D1F0BC